jgi:hypothetical protein
MSKPVAVVMELFDLEELVVLLMHSLLPSQTLEPQPQLLLPQ